MESVLFDRIRELCFERGITITKLEEELGFSKYSIPRWSSNSPSADKVLKAAAYFDVSVDYLLGTTDIRTTLSEFLQDEDMVKLQRARVKMTPKDKKKMMMMLEIGFEDAFAEDDKGE